MKLVYSSLCVLVLTLLMASCGTEQQQAETVEFLDGRYQALKPDSWSLMTDLNAAADLQMGNLIKEAYCAVLSEAKIDLAEDVTLEEFSALTRQKLIDSLEDLSVQGPESLEINGQPAIRYQLIGTINTTRIKYWHIAIESPEHFHQVLLWSLPSRFDSNQQDFETVMNSIRPVPQQPAAQAPASAEPERDETSEE